MGSLGEATRSPQGREFGGGGENGLRAPFILDPDSVSGRRMNRLEKHEEGESTQCDAALRSEDGIP